MNYFELYPGDYQRDTNDLSLMEHGAYLLLLSFYYSTEQPLSAPLAGLERICRAMSPKEKTAVKNVANRFFPVSSDGFRHNTRADIEIGKARRRIETAKANGSKGGRPPKENPAGNPAGNPGETQRVTQRGAQRQTHSGEALQIPDPTLLSEGSTQPPASPPDRVGSFEGHGTAPAAAPNPAAALAVALNRAGVQVTSLNPELIEAEREGVTAAALVELAALDEFKGKPATYVIRAARRMHAEKATTIATGAKHAQQPGHRPSLADRARRSPAAAGAIDGTATRLKD